MNREQLAGKFLRLRAELLQALNLREEFGHIERLVGELAETRRLAAALRRPDEQTGDSDFTLER